MLLIVTIYDDRTKIFSITCNIYRRIENTIDTVEDDRVADMTRKVFYSFEKHTIQNKTSRDEK